MKIGNISLQSNIFLAPMAGVTDFAFRSIAKSFGAGLTYTEMVSAKGLLMSKNKAVYKKMLHTLPNETPCAVQLFGSDEKVMATACTLPEIQKFDIIDINMGCPAPKVVRNGDGSALLLDTQKAVAIAKACVLATNKPITVKMRAGFCQDKIVAASLAKQLEEVGVKAITIHGRTTKQMYSGKVDLEIIRAVKQAVSIPVIGNGDVINQETLGQMLSTGVDGVMIGRGALGAPWIFAELLEKKPLSCQQKFEAITRHVALLQSVCKEEYLTTYLRKHFLWYSKGFYGVSETKVALAKTQSLENSLNILQKLFVEKE